MILPGRAGGGGGGLGRWPGTRSPFRCLHQGRACQRAGGDAGLGQGPAPSPVADAGPREVPDVFREAAGAGGGCGFPPADSDLVSGARADPAWGRAGVPAGVAGSSPRLGQGVPSSQGVSGATGWVGTIPDMAATRQHLLRAALASGSGWEICAYVSSASYMHVICISCRAPIPSRL